MNNKWFRNREGLLPVLCIWTAGLCACQDSKDKTEQLPPQATYSTIAGTKEMAECYDLGDILENGELIAVTLSGPDTYYEYRGKPMGLQYELAQLFATKVGTGLRMEVVRDTAELMQRIRNNEADLIAVELDVAHKDPSLKACGSFSKNGNNTRSWAVNPNATELAEALNRWYQPELKQQVLAEEKRRFSPQFSVTRRPRAPFLSRAKGIISPYDAFFKRHAGAIGWDWRLMAAQCYQESAFDPNAVSWAGARGLMQIMPETAQQLNLPHNLMHQPEANIRAAAAYLKMLERKFAQVQPQSERIWFVLASYNGGAGHITDAQTLARKDGKNANSWTDVKEYVLKLSMPAFYNKPDVKHGYMRGSETYQYVELIRRRWEVYRNGAKPDFSYGSARKQNKKK